MNKHLFIRLALASSVCLASSGCLFGLTVTGPAMPVLVIAGATTAGVSFFYPHHGHDETDNTPKKLLGTIAGITLEIRKDPSLLSAIPLSTHNIETYGLETLKSYNDDGLNAVTELNERIENAILGMMGKTADDGTLNEIARSFGFKDEQELKKVLGKKTLSKSDLSKFSDATLKNQDWTRIYLENRWNISIH